MLNPTAERTNRTNRIEQRAYPIIPKINPLRKPFIAAVATFQPYTDLPYFSISESLFCKLYRIPLSTADNIPDIAITTEFFFSNNLATLSLNFQLVAVRSQPTIYLTYMA